MRLFHTLVLMFLGSFFIQYYLMSVIMSQSFENVRNSYGKFYLTVTMGLFMTLLEIFMHDSNYHVVSIQY
jgi:hypothetical protein